MHRSISFNLKSPPDFLKFLSICSQIFNRYAEWYYIQKGNKNFSELTKLYYELRKEFPTIPCTIIQSLRDSAFETSKACQFKIITNKKSVSFIRYNARAISWKRNCLTIAYKIGEKRLSYQVSLPKFFQERYPNFKFKTGNVGWNKKKQCMKVSLIFQSNDSQQSEGSKVLGIDRGIYNLVTTSEGERFSSASLRKIKRKHNYLRKKLQSLGTRSAKRRLRALAGREKQFTLQTNHIISKYLVNLQYDIYVFEDLKGIRKQHLGKKLNTWLSNWPFYQLEEFVKYKAFALGKSVFKVDPSYTSQICSSCGNLDPNARQKSKYFCRSCGLRIHADVNAAINIKNRFINESSHSGVAMQKSEQAICQLANSFDFNKLETSLLNKQVIDKANF